MPSPRHSNHNGRQATADPIDLLLIRVDRMGDLILTLPVDQLPELKDQRVHWLIKSGLEFIAQQSTPPREVSAVAPEFSLRGLFRLVAWLRRHRVKRAVIFHAPWWVGLALCLGGVRQRVGRYSQWHSYLFLNRGQRQKRSRGDRHELDYNLDLMELLTGQDTDPAWRSQLRLELQHPTPKKVLNRLSLTRKTYYVVHPGMGGSALNWPTEKYIELIRELTAISGVVITGTAMDEPYLAPLRKVFPYPGPVRWLVGKLSNEDLIAVLQEARGVIAPSTGVIHLAASCGTPCLGFYSPRPAERARRWSPRGPVVHVLEPKVKSREHFPEGVMGQISLRQAKEKIRDIEVGIIRTQPK